MRRIGVLMPFIAGDDRGQARKARCAGPPGVGLDDRPQHADRSSLGRGDPDHSPSAAELVALAPDVIVSVGSVDRRAVAAGDPHDPDRVRERADPVGAGFVESLARPGGNATGFTNFEYGMSGKWLELLKEIAPRVTRAAVLRDPDLGRRDRPVRRNPVGAPRSAWS